MFATNDDQGPEVRFSRYFPTKYKQTNHGSEWWATVEAVQGVWVPKLAIVTDSRYLQQGASGKAQN